MNHGDSGNDPKKGVLPFLEEVHAAYDVAPDIQASLGFRLRAAGNYQRASELLLRASGEIGSPWNTACRANAAYCLLRLGDWPRAMNLLDHTMSVLEKRSAAIDPGCARKQLGSEEIMRA